MRLQSTGTIVLGLLLCTGGAAFGAQEMITFEDLSEGACNAGAPLIVHANGGCGPIKVTGVNPRLDGDNAACVFDSDCTDGCSGGDPDLGSPNGVAVPGGPGVGTGGESGTYINNRSLGNVMIVCESLFDSDQNGTCDDPGMVDNPDDQAGQATSLTVDFAGVGSVTVHSVDIIDVGDHESGMEAEMLLEGGGSVSVALPNVGDNGLTNIDLGPTANVTTLVLRPNGSGGFDNIVIECADDPGDQGCTPGFWKSRRSRRDTRRTTASWGTQHSAIQSPTPGDTFDGQMGCSTDLPDDLTMLNALKLRGGGLNALARHAAAALLNALSPDVNYDKSAQEVRDDFCAAVANGTEESTKDEFEALNELGCPLPTEK